MSFQLHQQTAALGLGYTIERYGERCQLVSIDTGQPFEHQGRDTFSAEQLSEALHQLWRIAPQLP